MKTISMIALLMSMSTMSFGQVCNIIKQEKKKTYVICENNEQEVYSLKKVKGSKSLLLQSEATLQEIHRIQNEFDRTQESFDINFEKAQLQLKLLKLKVELKKNEKDLGELAGEIVDKIDEIKLHLE